MARAWRILQTCQKISASCSSFQGGVGRASRKPEGEEEEEEAYKINKNQATINACAALKRTLCFLRSGFVPGETPGRETGASIFVGPFVRSVVGKRKVSGRAY